MSMPDFQSIMLPLLQAVKDGKDHRLADLRNELGQTFDVSSEELQMKNASGSGVFANRVAWSRVYLAQAGLLESAAKGVVRITPAGDQYLKTSPTHINIKALKQFPLFVAFTKRSNRLDLATSSDTSDDRTGTPAEALERSYDEIMTALKSDLLQQISAMPSGRFEDLIVELLRRLGYTGTSGEGLTVGRSGDGGIDGVIKQDRLGLRTIYVQAKRWQQSVGEPPLRDFVGALVRNAAYEGVFVTSSSFSNSARDFVTHLDRKVVLIDGEMLAELLLELNVGVKLVKSYDVKRVDADYFVDQDTSTI